MSPIAFLAAALVCTPVEPASAPDPAAASAYVEVGEAELQSGATDTALVAFREALRLDAANARAADAIARICAPPAPDPFDEGVRLLEEGDPEAALARFEEAQRQAPDAGVALMIGICRYELGEDDGARTWLLEAERDPETGEQARLFLGLVALRSGDRVEAASRFSAAGGSADPRISAVAGDLLKLSRRDGRLVVGVALDPRFDTNVALSPDGTPADEQTPDGAAVLSANLAARPLGLASGAYLNGSVLYRKQFTLPNYDFSGVGAAAGWEWARRNASGAAEVGVESYRLGGFPYLLAPRVLATAHWTPGRLSLGAAYRGRAESFRGPYDWFSGQRHSVTLDASWRFDDGSSITLNWRGERAYPMPFDPADLEALAKEDESLRARIAGYWETGPWLQGLWRAGRDVRLGLQLGGLRREFVATNEKYRRDFAGHAEVYAELDLGTNLVLRAGLGTRGQDAMVVTVTGTGKDKIRDFAIDESATYSNVFGSVGVAWVGGFL